MQLYSEALLSIGYVAPLAAGYKNLKVIAQAANYPCGLIVSCLGEIF